MAQVKFFGMLLDFQFVRDCYEKDSFSRLIFQPYTQNVEKLPEEYFLLVYALDNLGEVMERKDLNVVPDDSYDAPQRLELGNIAMTRLQLEPFIQEDRISGLTDLYLSPREFGEYVAYNVRGTNGISGQVASVSFSAGASGNLTNTEIEIKPSPPAPPAP